MIAPYLVEMKAIRQTVVRGTESGEVKRLQEWLCLHGQNVEIDSEFGPATEAALTRFQSEKKLVVSGQLDQPSWEALKAPLIEATAIPVIIDRTIGETAVRIARRHLGQKPREVGGDNRGPWVRHYCRGVEAAWCQGAASTWVIDAARVMGMQTPFALCDEKDRMSLYVPWVVNAAKAADKFQRGSNRRSIPAGSMAFIPGGEAGYRHVALVILDDGESIQTIEGNTNRDGGANGYEVALHYRRRESCDYGLSL